MTTTRFEKTQFPVQPLRYQADERLPQASFSCVFLFHLVFFLSLCDRWLTFPWMAGMCLIMEN